MGDYQPETGDTILVNVIKEKTASSGVSLGSIVKVVSSKFSALTSAVDIGDSTTPFKNLFVELIKYGSAVLTFASSGKLTANLGHTGFTSGGSPLFLTATKNTTTTTPVDFLLIQ